MITITFIKIWFLLFLIGAFGFPIIFTVFRNLPDRGYSICKYSSLVLISYVGWLLGHLGVEFVRSTLWIIALSYFAIGTLFFFLKRKEMLEFFKEKFVVLLMIELIFILSFGYFIKIASYNASIVVEPGTEAMMDYMMIQSILRSKVFPQWDLWFAGEKVNYYYFGWVNVASLKLLSGIKLPVVFNAAIALVYALIFTSAFGLGYNFSKKYRYAFLTSFLMVIIGNLNGFVQVIGPRKFFEMDWFQPARVIEGTINEFPYFSFIYGDLHSYVLAFPVALISLFISLNLLFEKKQLTLFSEKKLDNILTIIVYTITFGSLIPTNTWDYPAYFMMFFVSLAIRNFAVSDLSISSKIEKTFIPAALIFIAGIMAYMPYFAAFKQKREIKMVSYSRSDFSDFFQIFGTYMTITLLFMLITTFVTHSKQRKKHDLMFMSFILASFVTIFHQITFLYLAAYILFGFAIILKSLCSDGQNGELLQTSPANENGKPDQKIDRAAFKKSILYITALSILAASYGLACEFFYVNDHYDGKLERMNTIFKVYLEMWFIWSFAASFAVFLVASHIIKKAKFTHKAGWFAIVFIFMAMGMVYPISSTFIKTGRFGFESTLEGLKRAERIHPADFKAIKWMQENVEGLPVILEACGNAYEWASRFATFAGFPTILGWANHEAGWRNDWDSVNKRWNDINIAYQTTDIAKTIEIMDKYNVEYVIVGSLERKSFPARSLQKFKHFMDIVYDRDGVRIYKRKK